MEKSRSEHGVQNSGSLTVYLPQNWGNRESRDREPDITWTSDLSMRELGGALWSLVEHLLSIRTAGASEEKCERWKLGVRLTDIFNKYHAGLLIHKIIYKDTTILTLCYDALQIFLSHF